MTKQLARGLVSIIVLIGLLAFPVLAANTASAQPIQQSIFGVSHASLTPAADSQGDPSVRVWVNTKSGVYHCPGTRW